MNDILHNIESLDPSMYETWMQDGYYEELYGIDEGVDISLHHGAEKWSISYPIVDCMVDIRGHPLLLPQRATPDEHHLHDDDGQSELVGNLMQSLAEMTQV
jgi:hypothetical protein